MNRPEKGLPTYIKTREKEKRTRWQLNTLIYYAVKDGRYTRKEIAEMLDINYSRVASIYSEAERYVRNKTPSRGSNAIFVREDVEGGKDIAGIRPGKPLSAALDELEEDDE